MNTMVFFNYLAAGNPCATDSDPQNACLPVFSSGLPGVESPQCATYVCQCRGTASFFAILFSPFLPSSSFHQFYFINNSIQVLVSWHLRDHSPAFAALTHAPLQAIRASLVPTPTTSAFPTRVVFAEPTSALADKKVG